MAEVVRRRYSRVLNEAAASAEDAEFSQENPVEAMVSRKMENFPNLIIVDGGKGQLSSACAELQRLGLYDVNIIGLAKEFEEIYRPARPLPLRLPEDSGALMLLQRIRDEAHRFANGYHSLLLKKRISESVLDDIPGVSESRKKALLAEFGSLERIKRAPAEKLAAVSGIGPRLGEQIVEYLTPEARPKDTALIQRAAIAQRTESHHHRAENEDRPDVGPDIRKGIPFEQDPTQDPQKMRQRQEPGRSFAPTPACRGKET